MVRSFATGSEKASIYTSANQHVQVIEQELVIRPGDTEIARLSVLPLKPGLIRLVGLEWVLNGQAQGRQMFAAAKAPSHRRSGSRQASILLLCPVFPMVSVQL